MILAAEDLPLSMPKDPATIAFIVTALVWIIREMFDIFVKPRLRKLAIANKAKLEPEATPEHQLFEKLQEKLEQMTRLEQRLEDVFANSMQALKDLQQTTRELRNDHVALDRQVAVGLNRIDHAEMDIDGLRKSTQDFREMLQRLLVKHVK